MAEKQIVAAMRLAIKRRGGQSIKIHGGPYGEAGASDIIAVYRGRTLCIEVKRPGGKATRLQMAFLARWEQAGALVGVASEVATVQRLMDIVDEERGQ